MRPPGVRAVGLLWRGRQRRLLDELALAGAAEAAERYLLESSVAAAAVQKRLLRQRLVCCVAQAQADVLLSRLHLCLPGWRAAEGRRRRAEQQFEWQEAARARGLEWDARGTDSSDFDEPQGAHRHHQVVCGVRLWASLSSVLRRMRGW